MALKNRNIKVEIIINAITWAVILLLPFVFFFYNRNQPAFQSERFSKSYLATIFFLPGLFYLNKEYLIPKILASKKTISYLLIVLGYFFLYLTVLYYLNFYSDEVQNYLQTEEAKKNNWRGPRYFSTGPMTMFLLVFIISAGSKVIKQWFTAEEIKEEISKQQLQTELSLLKSQVNPHFLFNTLNSIYSLSVSNSDKAPDAVLKLSKIMRYTLEESLNDRVMLSQEIDFINSYIDLQKVRLTEKAKILFNTSGNIETVMIAPLIFIPFIENAFKYGISTHLSSKIEVALVAKGKELFFNCANDIVPGATRLSSTGTGISNTKRRLELLYPQKHTLTIENNATRFVVSLNINLEA
ncbi:sensor histidine kinase [Foetidibacter luteolus]|uniref:sensor histidine kinase n=1 Tax=Foetidibacter luteolus TaxID=2608880 RepID=UPI001A990CDB|nr:sensor histidine kinase [Foetidibacter luteolus]